MSHHSLRKNIEKMLKGSNCKLQITYSNYMYSLKIAVKEALFSLFLSGD